MHEDAGTRSRQNAQVRRGGAELIGVELIELRADLRAYPFDQRRGPELAADVVRMEDEHHDADDDEREGD